MLSPMARGKSGPPERIQTAWPASPS